MIAVLAWQSSSAALCGLRRHMYQLQISVSSANRADLYIMGRPTGRFALADGLAERCPGSVVSLPDCSTSTIVSLWTGG